MMEYRVIWQREGQAKKRALYQTHEGANVCADRQETAREDMDWLQEPLPEIVFGPVIERREVADWLPFKRRSCRVDFPGCNYPECSCEEMP